MTANQKMLLDTINDENSNDTKSLYYLLFGKWPKHDCLPVFKKSLWTIISSIKHGDDFYDFLEHSNRSYDVRIAPTVDETQAKTATEAETKAAAHCSAVKLADFVEELTNLGVTFYSAAELDDFTKVLATLKRDYGEVIYMMYRQPLDPVLPDYLLAEYTSRLLEVIANKSTALEAKSNLYAVCRTGLEYDEENPLTWDLEAWDFSVRTYNSLYRAGIRCTADLVSKKWSAVQKIRNLGQASQAEILRKFQGHGLTFAPEQS